MIAAARAHSASSRSARSSDRACTTSGRATLLRDGHIGDIRRRADSRPSEHRARASRSRSTSPLSAARVGHVARTRPGGARTIRARCLYHFRWFWDYSGGQTTNLLAHEIDIVQWVTGAVPVRVAAFGQRQSLTGFGETPDVFEAIFEYPDFLVTWSSPEVSAGGRGTASRFYGTRGTLTINRRGFETRARPRAHPRVADSRFTEPARPRHDRAAADRTREGRRLRPGARPVPPARAELPRSR